MKILTSNNLPLGLLDMSSTEVLPRLCCAKKVDPQPCTVNPETLSLRVNVPNLIYTLASNYLYRDTNYLGTCTLKP